MTRGLAIALLGCIVLTAARARSDGAAPGDSFDYLYVRAHEGDASGGHAAIRFGAWTYDFQHDAGWLTPRREDSRAFQHAYRTLENRSIEVSRIAVTPATVALLRDSFERRLLAQSRQLEVLEELRRGVALLETLCVAVLAFVARESKRRLGGYVDPAAHANFIPGRGLRDGLDGALWSVPELFFANIRKGTSEYVLPELRPPPG